MISDLFKVPIYKTTLTLDCDSIKEFCLSYRRNHTSREVSNIGGYQSQDLQGEIPELNDLFQKIELEGNKFAKQTEMKPVRLDNVWININGFKDYNETHVHSGCTFSGTYYVQAESEIVFHNPADNIEYDWNLDTKQGNNEYNMARGGIPPNKQELLIFPSWLKHSVMPNLSNEERITISFNLKLDK